MPKVCRTCGCAPPASCLKVCAVVRDCNTLLPVTTATFTVLRSGVSAGSCATTDGGVGQVTLTATGTGYTSAPTVVFTGGGGTGAAGVAVLHPFLPQVASVRLTATGTGYTSAPAVSFTGGGGSGAAATATYGGACCIGLATGGSGITYTVSAPGYTTFTSSSFTVSCGNDSLNPVTLRTTTGTATVSVVGCHGDGLAGATVTATQGATVVGTATTDGSGLATFAPMPVGSTTFTASLARFAFTTVTATIAACSNVSPASIVGSAASGYHCIAGCNIPTTDTLSTADSVFGGVTLTYNGAGAQGPGWYGSRSGVTARGTCAPSPCPPGATFDLGYYLEQASGAITVTVTTATGGCTGGSLGGAASTLVCPPSLLVRTVNNLVSGGPPYCGTVTVTWDTTE